MTDPVCDREPCDPAAARHCDVRNGESTLAGTAIARLVLSVMQVFKNMVLCLGVSKGGQIYCLCMLLGGVDAKQVWTCDSLKFMFEKQSKWG